MQGEGEPAPSERAPLSRALIPRRGRLVGSLIVFEVWRVIYTSPSIEVNRRTDAGQKLSVDGVSPELSALWAKPIFRRRVPSLTVCFPFLTHRAASDLLWWIDRKILREKIRLRKAQGERCKEGIGRGAPGGSAA